jgi:hypothetical protein
MAVWNAAGSLNFPIVINGASNILLRGNSPAGKSPEKIWTAAGPRHLSILDALSHSRAAGIATEHLNQPDRLVLQLPHQSFAAVG